MDWEYQYALLYQDPKGMSWLDTPWILLRFLTFKLQNLKGQSYETNSRQIKKAQTREWVQLVLQE